MDRNASTCRLMGTVPRPVRNICGLSGADGIFQVCVRITAQSFTVNQDPRPRLERMMRVPQQSTCSEAARRSTSLSVAEA